MRAKLGFQEALVPKFVRKGENETKGQHFGSRGGAEELGENELASGSVEAAWEGD